MAEKEISLLRQQREKLSGQNFDLEGWKKQTILLLQRIFGNDHPVVAMVGELKHDYSSWHLRDVTGNKEADDPLRIQARQILDAALTELETLGTPGAKEKQIIWDLLEEVLTGKQLKELHGLVADKGNEQQGKIRNLLGQLKKEELAGIIVNLLAR
ncbi:MAG: hypothetical protein AB7D05_03840 [Mangrovibacterium sp.]